jgi:hypothetical protein
VRALRSALVLVALSLLGEARAGAEPARLELVAVEARDPSSGYRVDRPASLKAGRSREGELAACARDLAVDIAHPGASVMINVFVQVAADGRVGGVELARDLGGPTRLAPSAAARCVGNLVAGWRLSDQGQLVLRFALLPPRRRRADLPADYLRALQAVCAVRPNGTPAERAAAIRAALDLHPSPALATMLREMAGRTPASRSAILRAVLRNAGVERCPPLQQ